MKVAGIKKSLNRQLTVRIVLIMVATILLCWLANSLLLEKFYTINKEKALNEVYGYMCSSVKGDRLSSEAFELEMQRYVGKHNVNIVIISSLFEPVKVYANESSSRLMEELRENLFGKGSFDKVLTEGDSYVIVKKKDSDTKIEYIEMWGTLPDASFFLMRTPMDSIKDSSRLANQFLLYIGISCVLISALVIYFYARSVSRPILELANISNHMADMDFDAKYTGNDSNELGLLGRNINVLSANLESTISELKTANIELKRDNEEKTHIDEMRKEFLSNVSHELKTPIALIQGYAEGLKEEVNDAEERDYYCDVIMDEASKMNIMVKKLLTLNQLEFGNANITMERFDICSLISNYVSNIEILTKQNGITVTCPDGECYVWSDEFMTEEVFNNLFSNAMNHVEAVNGEKRIDVTLQIEENIVGVTVFNTGKHIPEDSLPHLFEKFYKVDKARTREYGGSGVGLSIVKASMNALGREYGVENVEYGVAFRFTLERAK